MTFIISAFQMYVLHFGHFFENQKNSGLTPGQNDDRVTRTWKMTHMTHCPGDPMTQFHVWLGVIPFEKNLKHCFRDSFSCVNWCNCCELVTSTYRHHIASSARAILSSRQICLHTCGFLASEVVLEPARFIFESVLRVTDAGSTVAFGVTVRPVFIRRCHLVLAWPIIFWVQLRSALTTHNEYTCAVAPAI